MSTAITSEPDLDAEAQRVAAVHRLATSKAFHPELRRAEAQARVQLAAAVMAMDEVEDRIAGGEKIHSLHEQAAVERAKDAYAQALADLVRGESSVEADPSTSQPMNQEH
ncbi:MULTISPECIES: hypothetical protein [Paenarthrobacter]|uniref:Uncharacterized protein n=1 Tax=Paenarthrobacter ureafaciens TaxID=37931 RepID=A0AAX3EEJ7_PAEUR|nr:MULTISPECIES: hypothetical protein [Paenarthrobacter]NKR13274.1 hypothetical protein [Arthrobacter sp. M5]NKR14876.1 hypothetical protein [Arthrobacter sp. M6]OEH62427.1 hypothetical protein A5N13_01865 [Arthrobacter sp. D4]OEH62998.1 hypothetical protein A5N17_10105 [Arthrobacter sp. D2]MDO5865179.1 hypothetical protein [Paenarthrobacter sp. SD-2]